MYGTRNSYIRYISKDAKKRKYVIPSSFALSLKESHQTKIGVLLPYLGCNSSILTFRLWQCLKLFTRSCDRWYLFFTLQPLSHRLNIASLSLFPFQMFRSASLFSTTSLEIYMYDMPGYFHGVESSSFRPYLQMWRRSSSFFPRLILCGTGFWTVQSLSCQGSNGISPPYPHNRMTFTKKEKKICKWVNIMRIEIIIVVITCETNVLNITLCGIIITRNIQKSWFEDNI